MPIHALRSGLLLVSLCFVTCFHFGVANGQSVASKGGDLPTLNESISKANQLLKDGKIVECVDVVEQSTNAIQKMMVVAEVKTHAAIKLAHGELSKLQQRLSIEGAELSELPKWEDLLETKKVNNVKKDEEKKSTSPLGKAGGVSFSKDIAPWLVEQCSRCHINADRGGFSLATFTSLVKGSKGGVVLFPGDPIGSRLVETVETGDMPRSGNKVSAENLAKLKQWVTDGAKFDGPSPDAPIASLTANATGVKPTASAGALKNEPVKTNDPTGKETVSFARDIAPILISNCNGCHYATNQVQGGLRMDNFTQLVKGGESGVIIQLDKPDESLIVRKLRGLDGAKMPKGRPALPEAQIQLVATWIKQGASFDGQSKDARLDQVVSKAFAEKASHSELMAKRVERARDKWKIAAPKYEADQALDEQFHVIGNIGEASAKKLLAQASTAANQIRKMFKLSSKDTLIKGGITIYALKQRYDYSEFGKMIENRTLPAEWSSHWRTEVLDSYVVIVFDKSEGKINETSLMQQITSLWMSSHEGVPRWFAEGAGRQALAISAGPNDARVQPWIKRIGESIQQLKSLNSLSDGSMNDEALATIGFGVIRAMYDAKMKNQYEAMVRSLASGMSFEQATIKTIGPVDIFLQKLLGKPIK